MWYGGRRVYGRKRQDRAKQWMLLRAGEVREIERDREIERSRSGVGGVSGSSAQQMKSVDVSKLWACSALGRGLRWLCDSVVSN